MADEYEWGDVGDVVVAAFAIAIATGLENVLSGGKGKDAAGAQTQYALKQSIPPTVNLVGHYSRTAGAYAVYDTKDEVLFKLQAINRGRIAEAPTRWWLHDDEVERTSGEYVGSVIDGVDDGRYSGVQTDLRHRLGLPTETKYTDVWLDRFPYYKDDANFRLDNTASVMMVARAPKADQRSAAYPLGQPELSVAARGVCYDWRQDSTAGGSGSQRRNTPSTWGPSANPVVWLVHLEWYRWRMDWDRCIAPVLANLTAQANICDEAVALKAGGTEPRYTFAGNYLGVETQVNIRQRILDAMDGFWTLDGLGRLVIKAGKVETENLFTLRQDMIEGWTWQRGKPSEDAVSQIAVTFTSPDHKFNEVDCDPWVIDELAPNGTDLKLQWVYRLSQARRLAKRRASRIRPAHSGTIRTGPWGIFAFSERYIRVQNPQQVTMEDVVCEVLEAEIDPMSGDVVFTVIEADPNIDAWNATTEEGAPIQEVERPSGTALTAPTITDADAINDGGVTRVNIDATGPSRGDLTWYASWRVGSSGVWNDEPASSVTGSSVSLNTSAVAAVAVLQVRVTYSVGSGDVAPWSTTTEVDTRTTEAAPSAPTSLSLSTPSAGSIIAAVTQSASSGAAYLKIYRGTTNVFADAAQVNSILASPSQAISYVMSGLSAGTYYVWAVAATINGTSSTPAGPQSITIT